jgi:CubicO group peptidase (beta-lactamase class C family)
MSREHPAFDLVEPLMKKLLVPGAVVAIATAQGTEVQAFGTRTLGEDDPVTPDDHFRVGSNTKTMTGTALLQLVDARLVDLTDSVAKQLPSYGGDPRLHEITVEQVLDMRSGLYNYTEVLALNHLMDVDPAYSHDPQELIAQGLAEDEYFAPGEGFHYSNTNTCLAGLIVEHHSEGRPLRQVMQESVFAKAKISQTSLPAAEDATIPSAHPRGYMYGTNVSTIKTLALPADDQRKAYDGTLLPGDYTDLNPSWAWAAGAVISTAGDLLTYVQRLVEGGLLSDDLQRRRMESLRPTGEPGSAEYGWAIAKFGPMYGHDGSLPGFQSFMGHDPVNGNTLVILTNLTAAPDGTETANELAKAIIPVL